MLELRLNKNNQIDVTYMSETSAELSECSQCYLPFIYIILQHLDAGYTHIHTNTRAHTCTHACTPHIHHINALRILNVILSLPAAIEGLISSPRSCLLRLEDHEFWVSQDTCSGYIGNPILKINQWDERESSMRLLKAFAPLPEELGPIPSIHIVA